MNKKELLELKEENEKLKAEIRALNRQIGQRTRTIVAMESNFTIKMNMFRALASENERHQRFLTHMMKSSADFIILLDKELNVAYCSDLFLNKIGKDYFNEIEGKDIFDIYKRLNIDKYLRILKENLYLVLTSNKTCRHDILYDIEGKGEIRTFRVTNTPMISEDTGETSGIIIIWSDTTKISSEPIKQPDISVNPGRKPAVVQPVHKKINKKTEVLEKPRIIKKEEMPVVPGIDVKRGIEITGGSLEGYLMVLSIFCRDTVRRLSVLKSEPTLDKLPAYVLELHSISGAAAAVGVQGLPEEASKLKIAAEKGNLPLVQDKIQNFVKNMEGLVENIQKIL
jgi:HPt (histidine-containing phosphotransfer) domain-containing protein